MSARAAFPLLLAALTALTGCPTENPVDTFVKTPIEARGVAGALVDDVEAGRKVQAYLAKHGENPPSIEALEESEGKLKMLPRNYEYRYDPATGKIEVAEKR